MLIEQQFSIIKTFKTTNLSLLENKRPKKLAVTSLNSLKRKLKE